MLTERERRLSEFVDRENEMRRFLRLLTSEDKAVMVIWADGGVGKSSLLAKMIHDVATRGFRNVEIVWTETRNYDYLGIMRRIRDTLGPERFSKFSDLANYYTVPHYELNINIPHGSIRVGEGATFTSTRIENMAGVIIKDLMLVAPRDDQQISREEQRIRLTSAFIDDLDIALAAGMHVVFLDAAEKITAETAAWLWSDLLTSIWNGRLANARNLKVVICGRKAAEVDREWGLYVDQACLSPLESTHVIEYLARRGIAEHLRGPLADILLITSKGNTREIASLVDAYLRLQESKNDRP